MSYFVAYHSEADALCGESNFISPIKCSTPRTVGEFEGWKNFEMPTNSFDDLHSLFISRILFFVVVFPLQVALHVMLGCKPTPKKFPMPRIISILGKRFNPLTSAHSFYFFRWVEYYLHMFSCSAYPMSKNIDENSSFTSNLLYHAVNWTELSPSSYVNYKAKSLIENISKKVKIRFISKKDIFRWVLHMRNELKSKSRTLYRREIIGSCFSYTGGI